jgi:hypothetical protein
MAASDGKTTENHYRAADRCRKLAQGVRLVTRDRGYGQIPALETLEPDVAEFVRAYQAGTLTFDENDTITRIMAKIIAEECP